MQESDFPRFLKAYSAMEKEWEIKASPEKIKICFHALSDMPIDAVEKGIWHLLGHRTTATRLPTPGEIREAGLGSAEDAAQLALAKVERARREVTGDRSIIFDDPVIHRVINQYKDGWIGICEMLDEEWRFARHDFLKMYRAFSNTPNMQTPLKLIGRSEAADELNPQWSNRIPERVRRSWTVIFGEKAKALEWTSNAQACINGKGNLLPLNRLIAGIGRQVA